MESYNYWSQDTSESIEHHGILGQKWGVRRYQNEDGSLTEEGRKRYGVEQQNAIKNMVKRLDIMVADEQKKYIIEGNNVFTMEKQNTKKPKEYVRYAGEENVDNKRKYVVSNLEDVRTYAEDAINGYLPIPYNEAIYKYTYTPIKSIKKADTKTTLNYVVNKYGDTAIKEAFDTMLEGQKYVNTEMTPDYLRKNSFLDKITGRAKKNEYNKIDPTVFKEVETGINVLNEATAEVQEVVNKAFKNNLNDITKYFKSKGYDSIPDLEDALAMGNSAEILLTPIDSVKMTKKELLVSAPSE